MARRIYLVEDEISLDVLLKKYLEKEGYEVVTFTDGKTASEHITDTPDMWVLDIMLPEMDGYELIKRIKSHREDTPVIFMSARNEELDRVVGLELGSDDYLSKPFLPRELVIRVNRLMERLYGNSNKDGDDINLGTYILSRKRRTLLDENGEIPLTNNEFELLLYFSLNKNIVLNREQILDSVWGQDYFGSDRVVDDTIRRLRKKAENLSLDTVYGYGYKLTVK